MRAKAGLPFIVVIVACVVAASSVFYAKKGIAFEVSQTRLVNGIDIKWSTPNVSYLINESGGPGGSLNAVLAAMQTWSDVSGSSFVFDFAGETTSQTQTNSMDQKNIVSFQTQGQSGALATNYFWYVPSSGEMLESDILVNTSYTWRTDGAAGAYDVQNVVTHELGHSLSLDDLYDPSDSEKTMYGYADKGETKKRTLDQDDIDGIRYLYPGAGNQSPALISYDAYPTEGASPLTVTFNCSAVDYDGLVAQYYFDFGDGMTQTRASGSATHTYYGVGSYQASCVVFDNKGATASSQTIAIKVTDPQAWMQVPGQLSRITCGDLNGNGLCDLAGINSLDLIFYTTDLQTFISIPGRLQQLAAGDLNGDGLADLAGLTGDGQIYYSTDLASWTYLPGILNNLAAGDLNGDGRDDLVGVTVTGQIYYTLDLSTWQIAPGLLRQLACGDLNGDGKDDLIGLSDAGGIFYTLDLYNWFNVAGGLTQLTTGDLNGDGRDDLVGIGGNGQIFYTLNLSVWQTISGSFRQLASGDLNGDAKDDLVGLTDAGEIYYLLNPVN